MKKSPYRYRTASLVLPVLLAACASDPEPSPRFAGTTDSGPVQAEVYQQDDRHYQQIETRLRELQRLRRQGLISEQDYQRRRRDIISQL